LKVEALAACGLASTPAAKPMVKIAFAASRRFMVSPNCRRSVGPTYAGG